MSVSNIIFLIVFISLTTLFVINIRKIVFNINLGSDINRSDQKSKRWGNMIRVALGQSKMTRRPIAGILHILIYVGFVIINIEIIEIIIDGIFGTHRFLATIIPLSIYNFLIATFEILAFFSSFCLCCFLDKEEMLLS